MTEDVAAFARFAASPARALISGSIAFDTIMVFEGHFKDHILPEQVHVLNLSFLAPRLKREFGGCAANIGYNLVGLGGRGTLLGTIGHDGRDYARRLGELGIDMAAVACIEDEYTAQAFITTDLADNQIIAFHPGAMSMAHQVSANEQAQRSSEPCLGIVGPNGKEAMLRHASEMAQTGIPFIFDPGQGLPMFDGAELRELIEQASAVAVNDYEGKLIVERTGWSEQQIAERLQALIVTRGGEGSTLYVGGQSQPIAAVAIADAVDPTGCGDAYRGGLLYGLTHGWSWLKSARLGSVLGAIKIEQQGPQNHVLDRARIADRFEQSYGSRPW
ncbi:MAG: carbohydrate kinase family protein [Burkholderiaceae bacterium]